MGRCFTEGSDECLPLWRNFSDAFAFQQDDQITPESFSDFFQRTDVISSLRAPRDHGIFWSGISSLFDMSALTPGLGWFVMEISGVVGWLANTDFCGSPDSVTGTNASSCVYGDFNTTGDGKWHGTWVSFWAQASVAYSRQVRGDINIVLSGKAGHPAYRRDSFFSSIELRNIQTSEIGNVAISVLRQSLEEPLYERCGQGSLALLVEDLVAIGIPESSIKCENSPSFLTIYQCTRNPYAPVCKLSQEV